MDERGIPIVIESSRYDTTPKRSYLYTPSRYTPSSSAYFVANLKNEKSLLEAYDSFADACFSSHYNHSTTNTSSLNYSVRDLFRSEYYGSEKKEVPSSPLKYDLEEPETPRKRSRLIKSHRLEQLIQETMKTPESETTLKSDEQDGLITPPNSDTTLKSDYVEPVKKVQIGRITRSRKSLRQVEDIYMNSLKVSQQEEKKPKPPEPPRRPMTRSRYKSSKAVEASYLASVQVLSKPSPKKKPAPPPPKEEKVEEKPVEKPKQLTESDKEREKWELQRKQRSDYEIRKIMERFPDLAQSYELLEKTGSGTFSRVYKARDLLADQYEPVDQNFAGQHYVAIKLVLDISTPARIANEVECLMTLRSSPGVTPLITAFRHESLIFVVQPFIEFDHFDDFYSTMTMDDIRSYVKELLTGLKSTHEKGIMHRDVKPGNFLYNYKTKKGYLADFGLAQQSSIYQETKDTNPPLSSKTKPGYYVDDARPMFKADRSGTRGFRAPEIMLRYCYQTTAVDIWAVGVILLIILSGRYPFFEPEDDADGILELAHVFGLTKMKEFAAYYGRHLHTNISTIPEDELDIAALCKDMNQEQMKKWDKEEYLLAIDLMKKCLSLIHTRRPTATEALNHRFITNL